MRIGYHIVEMPLHKKSLSHKKSLDMVMLYNFRNKLYISLQLLVHIRKAFDPMLQSRTPCVHEKCPSNTSKSLNA